MTATALRCDWALTVRHLREMDQRARFGSDLERKLVQAAEDGDELARDQLVEAFLPLIASVARVYRNSSSVGRVELMQQGVVGLLNALRRYDSERGTPFWAYASWWVRQAMQELVAEMTGPMVLSDRALRQLARVKSAHREHLQAHGAEPSIGDLCDATGFPREHVEKLMAAERTPVGLDEPIGSDEGAVPTVLDMLPDPTAEDDFDRVVSRLRVDDVRGLPGGLSKRERGILTARYGLGRPAETLREVAGRLGLSAERVRQIEQEALGKVRAAVDPGPRQAAS
jgi:RNA polymerase sigma factor (sigma-70 family)